MVEFSTGRLFQGDCLEIMPTLEAESVAMILCDLPYGITQNNWDSVIPLDELWKQYKRVLTPNGVVALTASGIFTGALMMSNPEWFKYKIVWIKGRHTGFLSSHNQPLRKHEDILIFYQKQPNYTPIKFQDKPSIRVVHQARERKNQSGSYGHISKNVDINSVDGKRFPTDILFCGPPDHSPCPFEKEIYHSTQKPINLGRYLIRTFTQPGDIVLDNTCGSGSFLCSAILEKRNFIGIELNDGVLRFKKDPIDMIEISTNRINETYKYMEKDTHLNSLFENVEPPALAADNPFNIKGIVNVDKLIGNY